MASKTTVQLYDDIDGGPADETVEFALDGTGYVIDLTDEHAQELREDVGKWIDAARRTVPNNRPGSVRRQSKSSPIALHDTAPRFTAQNRKAIQRFAIAQGLPVPGDRGRIKADVSDAWIKAGRPS